MARIDTERLLQDADIVSVISRHINLKKRGSFYNGVCPFHDDHEASLEVVPSKRIYKCHPCGAGGDAIDFLMRLGRSFHEACKEIAGDNVPTDDLAPEQRQSKAPKAPQWTPITPVPNDAPPASLNHYRHGKPSQIWAYKNADGELLNYTCRFDLPEGAKEVLPLSFCQSENKTEWRWQGLGTPRPLYGLDRLALNPQGTVIIVEGEKTADALQNVMVNAVVMSWVGGANGIHLADWSPLAGRKVLIWPDNDWQGMGAAIQIAHIIQPTAALVKFIANPHNVERGWDFADGGWDVDTTKAWINQNNYAPTPPNAEPAPNWMENPDAWWTLYHPDNGQPARYLLLKDGRFIGHRIVEEQLPEEPTIEEPPYIEMPPDEIPAFIEPELPPVERTNQPFIFLGFDKTDSGELAYYFYIHGAKKVTRLTGSKLTKPGFLSLAPLSYWEGEFPKKNGFDTDAAMDWVIHSSHRIGVFKARNIRGRGAWLDKNRTVLHVGHHLIVNGVPSPLGSIESKYIYEQSEPIEFDVNSPVGTAQAHKFVKMMEFVNWERPINSYLLAGWCVIAPICGALSWRPHIWITGSAGTGKSWLLHKVVRRMLGQACIVAQGETSEAGLRQQLGHDAMPVLFDEAEGEDRRAAERMQQILALARAASTDDGGLIIKGTAGHTSKAFVIRSCFAFASISPQVSNQADRSRVSMLSIRKDPDEVKARENWTNLQRLYSELMNDEFVKGVQARTIRNIHTILRNAATFSNAAAVVIGEQRTGDQLGAMLAGAYSLFSEREISFDDAVKWISERDWSEEKSLDQSKDETALLRHLLEQTTSVETASARHERTVVELIGICQGHMDIDDISFDRADTKLRRMGIRYEHGYIIVSNSADWIRKTLRETAWSKNHNKILMRIPGAQAVEPTRFAGGIQTRGVKIPLSMIDN